jgi:predicted glutamine amidotransferase
MCRLLGYTSLSSTTFDRVVGKDFDGFVKLANDHGDGWGLATSADLFKEPVAATKSSHFSKEISRHSSTGALLHFRWATPDLSINQENTHPFKRDGISFIHNGALLPGDQLDPVIDPSLLKEVQGTTDSERYFLYLVTEIRKYGFVEGVTSALRYMKASINYSSINCMVMNDKYLIAACIYNPDRIPDHFKNQLDYYLLKFIQRDGEVVVGSSGWNQDGWNNIPNGSILVVKRSNVNWEIHAIQ